MAWRRLWRTPPVFNLVFWDLLISLVVVSVYTARLAHDLPKSLTNPAHLLSGQAAPLTLAPGALLRLGLFLATVLLIVTPFRVAGLYGGAAESLGGEGRRSFLYFFSVGRRLFWRGLVITGAGVALLLVVVLLGVGASLVGGVPVLGPLALAVWVLAILAAVTIAFRGLGALAAANTGAWAAIQDALRWCQQHGGPTLGFGLLTGLLLLAAFWIVAQLAFVPVLGPILAFGGLWVMTGMLAVLPTVLYRVTTGE